MRENKSNSVKIPSNLDVDNIREKIKILLEEQKQVKQKKDGSKKNKQDGETIINNHIDGLIYFINLITKNNYNELKFNENGYRRLQEELLTNIIGKGDDRKRVINIIKVLKDENIIEQITHRKGKYARGYRLTDKYNTGVYKEVNLSKRIQGNLLKFYQTKNAQSTINNEVQNDKDQFFLDAQFKKNNLTVEYETAIKFIKKLGLILLEKTLKISNQKNRDFTLESLLHYFGRMDNILIDLVNKQYHSSISDSNHRYNSNLTSLPKILRPFLRINDEKIGEVDISSSQPYILSTILNNDFTDSTEKDYNIRSIYPELHENFDKLKYANLSNQSGNTNHILGIFFNNENFNDLDKFINFNFTNDFYQNIITEGIENFSQESSSQKVTKRGRDYVKSNMMNFLFEPKENIRDSNDVIKLLNLIYPSLSYYIKYFLQTYGESDFALLLQRTEAYLMLNNVCKNLSENKPEIPFFTIHDSIITTVSKLSAVEEIMKDTITSITGKPVNVTKKEINETEVSDWVENKWKKIHITSQAQYDRMKPTFLHSNINKGIELLTTGNCNNDNLIQKFHRNIS